MAVYFRADGWVKTVQGQAIPGAQIWACQQPANVASVPPSPLVNIFSDPMGLIPVIQPIITDGFGHYDFYAVGQVYTLVVAFAGQIQQVYPDQSLGGVGSGGGVGLVGGAGITITGNVISATATSVSFQTDGVANTLQSIYNLKGGTGITLSSDFLGGVTVSAATTTGPRPSSVRWNYVDANITGAIGSGAATGIGFALDTYLDGTSTQGIISATATAGATYNWTATFGSTMFDSAQVNLAGYGNITLGSLKYWELGWGIGSAHSTGPTYYLGLTDIASIGGAMLVPTLVAAANFVGFRYDPLGHTDATWQCFVQQANVLPTLVDTGVVPDGTGAIHNFAIQPSGTNILFLIDKVQVGSIPTAASAGTSNLFFSFGSVWINASSDPTTNTYMGYLYDETL